MLEDLVVWTRAWRNVDCTRVSLTEYPLVIQLSAAACKGRVLGLPDTDRLDRSQA